MQLDIEVENRALIRPFSISTGSRTHQPVLTVRLTQGQHSGVGQATGVSYRGENALVLKDQIEAVRDKIEAGVHLDSLQRLLPAGGARAALDAALWDLRAKRSGVSVAETLNLSSVPLETAFTIVLDSPEAMAEQTRGENWRPLLKVKLGGFFEEEAARMRAVAGASGNARLVIDANAGWTVPQLEDLAPVAAELGFELIEQPLPAGSEKDANIRAALKYAATFLPLCADESFQTLEDFDAVRGLYQFINIKLDKCGGLTEAIQIRDQARAEGLGIFVGCMVAPAVAIAPAFLLAQCAEFVDLDGPFWFFDEPVELTDDGLFSPISAKVWGGGYA